MNPIIHKVLAAAAATFICTCLQAKDEDPVGNVIPHPQSMETAKKSAVPMKNHFKVSGSPINFDSSFDERTRTTIAEFASHLTTVTGKTVSYASPFGLAKSVQSGIVKGFVFYRDPSLGSEEYTIDITDKALIVAANDFNGVLYSIQTIKQMLPAAVYGRKEASDENWKLPCITIHDKPQFGHRGLMLDCARHFFSTDEIKKVLGVMAMFKLNRFHWHLTDDQGWRVEILSCPELTHVGAFREGTMIGDEAGTSDGIRYGGYYTQEQIREIVSYAANLGIEVIPEIDIPGHMQAALASYPELGCTGGPYEVATGWGVSSQVLCGGSDRTMEFLKTVLGEIAGLFPYKYIHIGGNDCVKDEWEKCPVCQAKIAGLGLDDDGGSSKEQKLQAWINSELQKFLRESGKEMIGWDETCEVGKTASALENGYGVILSPKQYTVAPLEKVYGSDPLKDMAPEYTSHIVGIQANIWSEHIVDGKALELMLLPRLLALSEIQWNGKCMETGFEDFKQNLTDHEFKVLDEAGFGYSKTDIGIH